MKRILLVVHHLWNGGGTETYIQTLAKALQHQGHKVGVYTEGGPWVSYFRKQGIPVHVGSFKVPGRLLEVVRQHNYKNVHVQDGASMHLISRLRTRPFRTIATVHGTYVPAAALRKINACASAVVCVSRSLLQYAARCGVGKGKLRLIPNGIATHQFYDNGTRPYRRLFAGDPGTFTIGYAGRFTFDKVELSKRISRILIHYQAAHPQTRVLIAGRGSKALVIGNENVKVLGAINKMNDFYRSCDCVIGTARVALEAMSCGKPVVAVGYYGYMGLINPERIMSAWRHNFGDHGANRQPWSEQRLIADLNRARSFPREKVQRTTGLVRKRFSAKTMAERMARCYRT